MAKMSGERLSMHGMVLGIVALAGFFLTMLGVRYVGIAVIVCPVIGLIDSLMGKHKCKAAGQPTGMAIAGIVLNIVAFALFAWSLLLALQFLPR